MFNGKFFGVVIMIAAIIGGYFAFKVLPAVFANSDLEEAMQECISDYAAIGERGCRKNFKMVIDEGELQVNPDEIIIEGSVMHPMKVYVSYVQEIYFPGDYVYELEFEPYADGIAPERF